MAIMVQNLLIANIHLIQSIHYTYFVRRTILRECTALSLHLAIAAGTHSDGVVESTQRQDQKEFYDFCTKELTLEKANKNIQKYNNFFN